MKVILGHVHPILFILTGNDDMHESSEEFDSARSDHPTAELAALELLKKSPDLQWEKRCFHFFSAVLDQILFIIPGNDDIHKSLDEFEIRPDPTTDHRVKLPLSV